MKIVSPPRQTFKIEDSVQKEIYKELRRQVGEGTASFFMDACKIMGDKLELASKTHLVAHLLREIDSSLRNVMLPFGYKAPKDKDFNNLINGIVKKYNLPRTDGLVNLWEELERIAELKDIKDIVKGMLIQHSSSPEKELITLWFQHNALHEDGSYRDQLNEIAKEYEIAPDDKLISLWLKMGRLHKLAHRDSLAMPRGIDGEFLDLWEGSQALLSTLLTLISENYGRYIKYIDELLAKPQIKADDIKELKNHLPNNTVTLGYFFDKLNDPACLPILRSKGFFANPIGYITHPEGGISYPFWPQSAFLVRMAKLTVAQKNVLEICLDLETENVRIQADILDVALSFPIELTLQLLEKVKPWIESGDRWILPEKFGKLIVYLINNRKVNEAIDLAKAVLAIQPDPKYPQKVGENNDYILPPDPSSYFDEHEYREILEEITPSLIKNGGLKGIELESQLLDDIITLSLSEPEKTRPEDYSHIWQAAIENHNQNRIHGLKVIILVSLRDACQMLLTKKPNLLNDVIKILNKHSWEVFDRIELHLLRNFPQNATESIKEKLLNKEYFNNLSFQHEYYLLAQEQCKLLTPEEQQSILTYIQEGPKYIETFKKRLVKEGRTNIEKTAEIHIKLWKQHHLAPFTDSFPAYKSLYEELTKEVGEAEHPEFRSYMSEGSSFGPSSPKTAQELLSMELEKTVEFMRTWQPSAQRFENSREGLGREFTKAVSENPDKYAMEAENFKNLDPTYIRALLNGLREANKKNKVLSWEPILNLCSWIIEQPKETVERETHDAFNEDPDWDWSFNTIVEFLSEALRNAQSIPISFREEVWKIIEKLTHDPNPSREYEIERGEDFDPASLAINSTRPEAINAVIEYALWIRRVREKEIGEEQAKEKGFSETPEVRTVLEDHLTIDIDSSLSVRSIYGSRLTALIVLDKQWVSSNLESIFPRAATKKIYRKTAWDTYIDFTNPFNEVLDVIRDEYLYSINEIGQHPKLKSYHVVSPDERLAQHLMSYYWGEKLNLDSDLILEFYEKANDEIAAAAMDALGRGLEEVASVDEAKRQRMKLLWEQRIEIAKQDPSFHKKEVHTFGWWFVSKKFDDLWSITQLEEVLKITGDIEADNQVFERLIELSTTLPKEVIQCARLLIDGDRREWAILYWQNDIKGILEVVLKGNNDKAKEEAVSLINRLISLGYVDFSKFLPQ